MPFYLIDGVERGRRVRLPADLRRRYHANRAEVASCTLIKYIYNNKLICVGIYLEEQGCSKLGSVHLKVAS